MKLTKLVFVAVVLLSAAAIIFAAGKGGRGDAKSNGGPEYQKGDTKNNERGNAVKTKDRDRIREKLKLELGDCERTTSELRTMTKTQDKIGSEDQLRIREKIQAMDKIHSETMAGLNNSERARVKNQIKNAEKLKTQLNKDADNLDKELKNGNTDQSRIRSRLKEMEKTALKLENQYRAMEWELNQ